MRNVSDERSTSLSSIHIPPDGIEEMLMGGSDSRSGDLLDAVNIKTFDVVDVINSETYMLGFVRRNG